MELQVIGTIYNDFHEKFGIPRQSGLVPEVVSTIVFSEDYRKPEALSGIEGYSHLWLLWQFSECAEAGWRPTVRPPRLGGNKRMGVFATRSPFRPNSIGLSSVVLLGIEKTKEFGSVLKVSGADLMNGTPILDIKPYIAYTDSHPEAKSGFADQFVGYHLEVSCPQALLLQVEPENRQTLLKVLEQDPRPAYQDDENRIYKMDFGRYTVSFRVEKEVLTVENIERLQK
ncbi:MAG: tRNA (N6-threonylcarbamoyladenosine(37)-N6)-methyltransferase TrmO [Clostridia bacterium]|nr:tRNA (N6-threonylcarbamoyladenosine(37)-N6)-methyltransferase TrmO [Clostridia bacterium]